MTFCINCGALNKPDAVFCSSCGQTLYHGPEGSKPRPSPKRFLFPLIASLVIVIAAVVVVRLVRSPSGTNKKTTSSAELPQKPSPITDTAVLMIVGTNRSGSMVSQGSGFILTSDGLAGTNYHVLEGAAHAFADCCSGREFVVDSIEGADLGKDLVVFQLYEKGASSKPQNLPHVTLGSSKDTMVGAKVVVIGSPQGLENTVSDGILSASREVDSIHLLQITAPISPGSSGGPVFNEAGKVIGVATFQFEKGQNLNFAVAVEHVNPLLDQHFHLSLAQFRSFAKEVQRDAAKTTTTPTAKTPTENNQPVQKPLVGQFSGIVHNLTVNQSAEFVIVVNDTDGFLSGCMGVRQPLFGSGPLSGVVAGDEVEFFVTSAVGTITFFGHRESKRISGTYTVETQGYPNQEGTFTLQKFGSKGPRSDFDTSNCPTDAEMNQ